MDNEIKPVDEIMTIGKTFQSDGSQNETNDSPSTEWIHMTVVKQEEFDKNVQHEAKELIPISFPRASMESMRIKQEKEEFFGWMRSKEDLNCVTIQELSEGLPAVCGFKTKVKLEEFADEDYHEIPVAQSSSFVMSGPNCCYKKSPESNEEIKIEEYNVKNEVIKNQQVVVVISIEKRIFSRRNFVCSVCFHIFSSFRSLMIHRNIHMKSNLQFTGSFECGQCNFSSAVPRNLRNHQKIHTGEKPFECDQCDFKSAHKHNLKNHKMIHSGEKPYICNQCHYSSARKDSLKEHKMTHSMKKTFKCMQCDYTTAFKAYLKTHTITHSTEKPFVCNQCDYKSSNKKHFNIHRIIHSTEKQFSCDLCDYKSYHKSQVTIHQKKHSIEKPFKCNQCDYRSASKPYLTSHLIKHSNQKPFACGLCDYKSSRKYHVTIHQKNILLINH